MVYYFYHISIYMYPVSEYIYLNESEFQKHISCMPVAIIVKGNTWLSINHTVPEANTPMKNRVAYFLLSLKF